MNFAGNARYSQAADDCFKKYNSRKRDYSRACSCEICPRNRKPFSNFHDIEASLGKEITMKIQSITRKCGERGQKIVQDCWRPSAACDGRVSETLYFCKLNPLLRRNRVYLNKAIPERGTIPTPGAASQGCLCK